MPNSNLNALLNSMIEGMILQDNSGKIIQFNQAALDILGLTEEQLNQLDFIDSEIQDKIFPGKDHVGMMSLKTGAIQRNVILNIIRRDGEMRWISLNAVPIFNEDKSKPAQLVSTFTDITEMRNLINELKQVELLFNISHDLMVVANQEGHFKKINPRFNEVMGYDLSDVITQKFINFVHPDDLEATQIELNNLLKMKNTHFINRYKTKNEEYRVFDWVVVTDQETNLTYFTARDITDYRSEEIDLIHSSKVYSIGEMTSCFAYIIHSQLAIIGGHIDFIQNQINNEDIDPQELKNKIHSIEESIERLTKTTRGLTSFARNTENEHISQISLARILENVLSLCMERFRIHSVKLTVQLEEDLIIRCRETQIAHVFITLLNNAYNAVHEQRDSWVKLIGKREGENVKIFISESSKQKSEEMEKIISLPRKIIEENFGTLVFDNSGLPANLVLTFPLVKNELGNNH